jgi:hypothetical protein
VTDDLFTGRWVHLEERDTPEGAVYVPDDEHVPLSRKPRDWLELHADGTATMYLPGAADRPVERRATWADATATPAARQAGAGPELLIVRREPARLVVKVRS